MEVMLKHINDPVPRLPDGIQGPIRGHLKELFNWTLAKTPKDRPQTCQELKESQDEWRLPMPHPDGPRASFDEGEQMVGREIMVDQLGVGKVTDFHDFHDFNIRENHDPPWTSAHTVRFFENGLDTHGVERTVKLMTADEMQWMKDVKYEKLQDPKIRARVSASHSPSWDPVLPSDCHRSLSLLDCLCLWARVCVLA